jgi:hypothetical protein
MEIIMGESTVRDDLVPTVAEKAYAQGAAAGVELVSLGAPILADVDRIVAALDPVADGALTIAAQPDVPRNVTVTVTDANDSVTCTCTIRGKDLAGRIIEEVAQTTLGTGKVFAGTKMFAKVDSAVVSGTSGAAAGDTISVGVGDVIALPKPIVNAAAIKHAFFGGAPVTPDAIATGESTSGVDTSGGTYDGSKELRVAYYPGA